jgi:regulatory protein
MSEAGGSLGAGRETRVAVPPNAGAEPLLVTDLAPGPRGKQRVFIGGTFAFVLYIGEVRHYGLAAGGVMSAETYREIIGTVLPSRARSRAFHLLAKRRYTETELRRKLTQGEYPGDIIEMTLEYLKTRGFIDDGQYAHDYIDYHLHERSHKQLLHDLDVKGIAREITDVIYSELSGGGGEDIETRQIRQWLEKKNFHKNKADFREKQRIFAFLCRRGFEIETIKRVLLLDI